MQFRVLGSTGLKVSVIGIGTWQLGGEWGKTYSQTEADAIFDKGAELGINLIDTAECYGDHTSENFIGDYLARHDRSRWIVATKFGHQFHRFMDRTQLFSPADVRQQLEASLRALRVDTIDLYQFHSGEDAAFQNDELWSMLTEQKRAGKIRHLGVSILGKGSELQAREARQRGAEVLQVIYNRLDRRPEQTVFPHAKKDNLGILARVPLASGLLSGKYKPGSTWTAGDVRATFDRDKMERDLAEVERIATTEVLSGVPLSQWALAWCLQNPLVSSLIPGCKDPAQVEANARAADMKL
ncbi:MAG TPA: aldo/keto reductase, partial [Candidatus Dormibacteraeota bacterium]|nr:aldo/keto reductase [Candidatus Dormibacteraeota bacterium]